MRGAKQVEWFKQHMLQKLAENGHKEGWSDMYLFDLLELLKEEVRELEEELYNRSEDPEAIIRECADVANFAMMIADIAEEHRDERIGLVDVP